jgi:MFS family permease
MSPVEISDLGNGALLFTIYGLELRLVEVKPLYFRQPDGLLGVVFREDDRGRITHMFTDLAPQFAFEKLNWYETPGFNMALLLGSVLIFLSMIPVAAIRFMRDRRRNSDRKPASHGARVAYWIILGISVLDLLFVVGTVLMVGSLGFPMFGVSLIYRIVLGLGVLSAVLTVGAFVYTVLAWKNRYWGIAGRAYYTLVTVAAVAFVWFMDYWNLLGWRF